MKFFVDTANIDEIREAHSLGILDGVTTNPSLVAKTGKGFRECVEEICELVEGPVSLEVVATDREGIVREAHDLVKIGDNVVVKVPLLKEGLKAVRDLASEGIKTNVTLCFTATQALLAAKAGATYISPFIGRLDDRSQRGMDIIEEIRTIYDNYDYPTEVLVASIRHPMHVLEAALVGADIATMPMKVFEALVKHPLTDLGLEAFLKDWEKVPDRNL
jgi:transaldolase